MKERVRGEGLEGILQSEELKELFKHFSITTGLDVALYGADGRELLRQGGGAASICALAARNPHARAKCCESMKYGGEKSAQLGEPYIFSCPCGLIKCSAPILLEDRLLGSIGCGPVLLWERDDLAFEELKEKTRGFGLAEEELQSVLAEAKQLPCVNMTSAARILFVMVNYMCREENRVLRQRAEMNRQQMQIANMLIERKQDAASLEVLERTTRLNQYPLNKEKELIAFVQMGDEPNAKRMLNELLGEIFSFASGNLDNIKARLYELSAILSRAAVDAGAPLEALTDSIREYTRILGADTDFEQLCYMTSRIMEDFMRVVYEYRGRKQTSRHLARAIRYIKDNFREDLTLEGVAGNVFVSSFYLSHLFREEMDVTFSDYVARVRMEEAKKLLKDNSLKIQAVAELVGFADANYFAKTFKKFYGVSPKHYKLLYV